MTKKLTKHGNSLALIIDRAILQLLHIDSSTPLNISTDGEALIIMPEREKKHNERFKSALNKVNKKYGSVLKKLAE